MKSFIAGLIAGCGATLPMTLFMEVAHHWPEREKEALPPRLLTEEIAFRAEADFQESDLRVLTLLNHFGFGTAAGGLYGLLLGKVPLPAFLKGAVWGMAVWSCSYLGWIPAARLMKPATEHRARRNALMIGAHLVWGITTAVVAERLRSTEKEEK